MDLIAALDELHREKQKLERVIAYLEELNAPVAEGAAEPDSSAP